MRMLLLVSLASGLLLTACTRTPTTSQFLTKAIQGDNSEMRLGALAATKGGPAIANFGHMLEVDHAKARNAAIAVASQYGITAPTDMLPEAEKEQRKLEKLNGSDFDKEFARYMVEDHKQDVADFQNQTESDAPDSVKTLARDTLSDLRKHLALAESLQ